VLSAPPHCTGHGPEGKKACRQRWHQPGIPSGVYLVRYKVTCEPLFTLILVMEAAPSNVKSSHCCLRDDSVLHLVQLLLQAEATCLQMYCGRDEIAWDWGWAEASFGLTCKRDEPISQMYAAAELCIPLCAGTISGVSTTWMQCMSKLLDMKGDALVSTNGTHSLDIPGHPRQCLSFTYLLDARYRRPKADKEAENVVIGPQREAGLSTRCIPISACLMRHNFRAPVSKILGTSSVVNRSACEYVLY
jgi:hypothetical protein